MCITALLLCLTSLAPIISCVTLLFVTYSVGVKELTDCLNLKTSMCYPHRKNYQCWSRISLFVNLQSLGK